MLRAIPENHVTMHPDSATPAPVLGALASAAGTAAVLGLGALALTQAPPAAPAAGAADSLGAPPALAPCTIAPEGYWRGTVTGSGRLALDWRGAALACAGNARPGGRGLRLFFAGHPGGGVDRLVLVIGIDARVGELAGREHPVSLTLIDEQSSQFFHSPGDRCFTRVAGVTPLGTPGEYRVEGELYCAGAVAAVAGEAAVTLGDMTYAGRLSLEAE
jgi:hypothetical protein